MATLEREFSARWGVDEVFRYFRDGILAGSQSVTDGGGGSRIAHFGPLTAVEQQFP